MRAAELATLRSKLAKNPQANRDEKEEVVRRQRALSEQRRLALRELDAAPQRITAGPVRFLAHALELPPTGEEEKETFNADVEKIAMAIAADWERDRHAAVKDVSTPPHARIAGLGDHPGSRFVKWKHTPPTGRTSPSRPH